MTHRLGTTHYGIDEMQRQLMIRSLAIQALVNPGFKYASREAAVALYGAEMFDEFERLMSDLYKPVDAFTRPAG